MAITAFWRGSTFINRGNKISESNALRLETFGVKHVVCSDGKGSRKGCPHSSKFRSPPLGMECCVKLRISIKIFEIRDPWLAVCVPGGVQIHVGLKVFHVSAHISTSPFSAPSELELYALIEFGMEHGQQLSVLLLS